VGRFGWRLVIPQLPIASRGFTVAPKRWTVKCTFAWLVQHRRLHVDYQATIPASMALIHVAMLHLTLPRPAHLSREEPVSESYGRRRASARRSA
jgi:transposase